jgi:hypothetical protein
MFDRLWFHLHRGFRVRAVRTLREYFMPLGLFNEFKALTDKECDDWEDMYLMGGEL